MCAFMCICACARVVGGLWVCGCVGVRGWVAGNERYVCVHLRACVCTPRESCRKTHTTPSHKMSTLAACPCAATDGPDCGRAVPKAFPPLPSGNQGSIEGRGECVQPAVVRSSSSLFCRIQDFSAAVGLSISLFSNKQFCCRQEAEPPPPGERLLRKALPVPGGGDHRARPRGPRPRPPPHPIQGDSQ